MSNLVNFGYLDPSVVTYSIQVIIGIVVSIAAFVGVYWRNFKNILQKKFNIKFGVKKEIESDDIYLK